MFIWFLYFIDIIIFYIRWVYINVKDCLNSLWIRNIIFSVLVILGIICVIFNFLIVYVWYVGKLIRSERGSEFNDLDLINKNYKERNCLVL